MKTGVQTVRYDFNPGSHYGLEKREKETSCFAGVKKTKEEKGWI